MTLLPVSPEELTPDFLTGLLCETGHDVEVISVGHERVGSGQMAGSYRLTLDYTGDDARLLPPTMIAKLATGDVTQREVGAGAFANEVRFYREFAPGCHARVPRCHGSAISENRTEFVLLLEDMSPAVQGDQIAGASPDLIRDIAVAAVGLHGPYFNDAALLGDGGFPMPGDTDRELLDSVLQPLAQTYCDRLDPGVLERRAIDWMVRTAGQWLVTPIEQVTLIHGDFRLDNVLLAPTGEPEATTRVEPVPQITIVDWQTISAGHPLRDISYLIATGLPPELRREHEMEILSAYHGALGAHGVDDYEFEDCMADYITHLIGVPLIVVLGAAAAQPSQRGDHMFATMLSRGAQALADLAPEVLT